MATFYQANVTATNGQALVTVNSSNDDIAILRERSFLQIGTNRIVEVKRGISGTPDQIELAEPWPFDTVTADAISGPTAGDLADAVNQIKSLNTQAADILADALLKSGNLFGLTDTAQARTNLGLGSAAEANILGTVSQSGGVPTGAIIESSSNANGEFVKWADGTIDLSGVYSFDLGIETLQEPTMPASFIAGSVRGVSFSAVSTSVSGTNDSLLHLIITRALSSSFAFQVRYEDAFASNPGSPLPVDLAWNLRARWF